MSILSAYIHTIPHPTFAISPVQPSRLSFMRQGDKSGLTPYCTIMKGPASPSHISSSRGHAADRGVLGMTCNKAHNACVLTCIMTDSWDFHFQSVYQLVFSW